MSQRNKEVSVKVLRQFRVSGNPVKVGTVVEVDEYTAAVVVASKRAKYENRKLESPKNPK